MKKRRFSARLTILVLISCFLFLCSFFALKTTGDDDYIFPKIKHFPPIPKFVSKGVTNQGVELGRLLFYDPILSRDSTVSCSSCHRQEFAFSYDPNYRFKQDNLDLSGTRNILPIFNLAWSTSFFWDGRVESLEEQVSHPIKHAKEMNSNWALIEKRIKRSVFYQSKIKAMSGNAKVDSALIINLISQFEKALISYNSKFDKVMRNETKFTQDELDGYMIMLDTSKGNCFSCHTTDVNKRKPKFAFSNNGLYNDDELKKIVDAGRGAITKRKKDIGKFKIPSLRNLSYTTPYMHDGRFHYLDFVINFYSDGIKTNSMIDERIKFNKEGNKRLTKMDKRKIVVFLSTLNDSVFVTNKAFSNPFN